MPTRPLQDVPIRRKLTLVILLASSLGLLMTGAIIVAYEWNSYRAAMRQDLNTLAGMMGEQSSAALLFLDQTAARENLSVLRSKPAIRYAAIYGAGQEPFAVYSRAGNASAKNLQRDEAARSGFTASWLEISRPIIVDNEPVGLIYIQEDLDELHERIRDLILIVLLVIFVLLLVTLGLSAAVQRAIADPIVLLAQTANAVGEDKDYAVRATGSGRDEVGQLVRAFNGMLEQIEASNATVVARDEEVRQTSQQLWQTAKLATMGELVASIAHELNNPMATVSLHLESLQFQLPPEHPSQPSLSVMLGEVERMGNLVTQLLQFSRRTQQQISTVHLPGEVESTLELVQFYLKNRNVTVECNFNEPLPPILADHQQIKQVLLNIITNASDAMPGGGALHVTITSRPPMVVLEMQDSGVGIAPENMARVMEPFFTTKPEGKGTGLGLGICRRIIGEHGGNFEIESIVGQGTTIIISLPAAITPEGEVASAPEGAYVAHASQMFLQD